MEVWTCVVILMAWGVCSAVIGLLLRVLCARQVERVWQAEGWKGICAAHRCASSCMWKPHRQVECGAQTKTLRALIQCQPALFPFDNPLLLTTDLTNEWIGTNYVVVCICCFWILLAGLASMRHSVNWVFIFLTCLPAVLHFYCMLGEQFINSHEPKAGILQPLLPLHLLLLLQLLLALLFLLWLSLPLWPQFPESAVTIHQHWHLWQWKTKDLQLQFINLLIHRNQFNCR